MTYWRNKVAIVTGGSSGFGRVLAGELAASGTRVVIAARNQERLDAAVTELTARGGEAMGIRCDVRDDHQVQALIDQTLARYGQLNLLACNAGKSTRGRAATTSVEEFREFLELNFLSTVRCVACALPHLRASRGHAVLVASLGAKAAGENLGPYPASKAPLSVYAQQLRLELAEAGVHVLLVCPGPIARTDEGRRYDDAAAGLPPSARQPGGGIGLTGIDPTRLANQVFKACRQRRAELIVPAKAKWFLALSALWPSLGDRIIQRMTRSSSTREEETSSPS